MSEITATANGTETPNDMTKREWIWKEMKRNYIAYVMCAPFFLIFLLFTILPVILSIFFSFTIFNLIEPMKWVFLDNYIRLFLDDDIFILAVQNTLIRGCNRTCVLFDVAFYGLVHKRARS